MSKAIWIDVYSLPKESVSSLIMAINSRMLGSITNLKDLLGNSSIDFKFTSADLFAETVRMNYNKKIGGKLMSQVQLVQRKMGITRLGFAISEYLQTIKLWS